MNVIALLTALANLISRLLDKADEYHIKRKQFKRDERQASVQANPNEAFADLFGKPSNKQLYKPIDEQAINNPVRSDLSTIIVDKNGKR